MLKIHDIGGYLTQMPQIRSNKDREWIPHAQNRPEHAGRSWGLPNRPGVVIQTLCALYAWPAQPGDVV